MTDVTKPSEQVETLRPEPVEKGALEKKVTDAMPALGKVSPEVESADQAVKRNLEARPVDDKIEAERKVADAALDDEG